MSFCPIALISVDGIWLFGNAVRVAALQAGEQSVPVTFSPHGVGIYALTQPSELVPDVDVVAFPPTGDGRKIVG